MVLLGQAWGPRSMSMLMLYVKSKSTSGGNAKPNSDLIVRACVLRFIKEQEGRLNCLAPVRVRN